MVNRDAGVGPVMSRGKEKEKVITEDEARNDDKMSTRVVR